MPLVPTRGCDWLISVALCLARDRNPLLSKQYIVRLIRKVICLGEFIYSSRIWTASWRPLEAFPVSPQTKALHNVEL